MHLMLLWEVIGLLATNFWTDTWAIEKFSADFSRNIAEDKDVAFIFSTPRFQEMIS